MRLVLVHGFTQTGRSWRPVANLLVAKGHEVVCPDLPGHGTVGSVTADIPETAAMLAAEVDEVDRVVWVGYSMGGRVCLQLALDHPEAVRGLVLVSTTAGIVDASERATRVRADEHRAREVEELGVMAFVDRWLAAPMWATLSPAQAGIEQRLANTAAGLAMSLRQAGTGAQAPLWDRLEAIRVPVLVVTGDLDQKFTVLGDELARVTRATRRRLSTGHAVPWEQPEAFAEAVDDWVTRTPALNQGPTPA